MGHLSRCLQLASNLKKLNIFPYFLVEKNDLISKIITEVGIDFFYIPSTDQKKILPYLVNLHKKIKFKGIIIDSRKSYNRNFFKKVNLFCKTIVIWNNTNFDNFYANYIILPEIKEQYSKRILQHKGNLLLGSKYIMLGKISKSNFRKKNSILISMGGSDKRQISEKIIDGLRKTRKKFHANIVIGRFFKNTQKIKEVIKNDSRFSIIQNNDNLIQLMQKSIIGIFSLGIIAYEA